jgi:hypothetical protein
LHAYGSPLAQVPKVNEKGLAGSARSPLAWPAYQLNGGGLRGYQP